MSPAEILRAAAERASDLHCAATPSPWIADGDRVNAEFTSTDNDGFTDVLVQMGLATSDDMHLIADVRPVVEHMEPLFRYTAEFVEEHYSGEDFPESSLPTWVKVVLPLARAILGGWE